MEIRTITFPEIWLVHIELAGARAECPEPVYLTARELITGKSVQLNRDELQALHEPPYRVDGDVLIVVYNARDLVASHLERDWQLPTRVLDLFTEFRCVSNGLPLPCGNGLMGALAWYGKGGADALTMAVLYETERLQWKAPCDEQSHRKRSEKLLDGLEQLYSTMEEAIDLPRALIRGRYMKAVAHMERCGVPLDLRELRLMQDSWQAIRDRLTVEVDKNYGVYDGRSLNVQRFADYLHHRGITWPTLPGGYLDLSDDAFKEMASIHPEITPLRQLRGVLFQKGVSGLAVGSDGCNRCSLEPFSSRTGRNQPSSNQFIFGAPVWLRGLIRPSHGMGIAYLDWAQQEFGIAAALSGDSRMQEAYLSGDPYLAFAVQAGAVPPCATKISHSLERRQFKECVLAVQYGMGAKTLARRIGQSEAQAQKLLQLHRDTYCTYWAWSDQGYENALLQGKLETVFGWCLHLDDQPNPRSLRNFPMQANGAEMLRLACCLAVEAGITVCAPVHDAILIEAPLDELDEVVDKAQAIMAEASAQVLDGFRLRTDMEVFRYPDRYMDERGCEMWELVEGILNGLDDGSVIAEQESK